MTATRRLAAILAADVAGYSRLMGADEEGTHERLKAHLRELVEPKIAENRGRIVKNTGDGLLADLGSNCHPSPPGKASAALDNIGARGGAKGRRMAQYSRRCLTP